MLVGLGLDIVELDRIARSLDRFGERFLQKILTDNERRSLPRHPLAYVAARFAAKEAAVKALGTGFAMGITPLHIEICNSSTGKPEINFLYAAQIRFHSLGATSAHISLTHSQTTAAAVVILEA